MIDWPQTHSWPDSLSSLGVLVGLIAVAFGARWGDPVAGLAITLLIGHVGWKVTSDILRHLMDSIDPEIQQAAERAVNLVPGVWHAHVRARWMGRTLLVEVEGFLATGTAIESSELWTRRCGSRGLLAVPEARAGTVVSYPW